MNVYLIKIENFIIVLVYFLIITANGLGLCEGWD